MRHSLKGTKANCQSVPDTQTGPCQDKAWPTGVIHSGTSLSKADVAMATASSGPVHSGPVHCLCPYSPFKAQPDAFSTRKTSLPSSDLRYTPSPRQMLWAALHYGIWLSQDPTTLWVLFS